MLVQLLAVLPLSVAAGVDLYLTLLFLATAPRLGWDMPPPGDLVDLAVPAVLGATLVLYILERWIENKTLGAILWNAAHTVIRPLGGALLAWMALADLPLTTRAGGAFAALALALAAHVTRSGWGLVLVLMPSPGRVRLLVSLAEDAGVLAILSLLLDAPIAAAALATFTIGAGVRWGTSASSAFIFALRLVWDAVQGVLNHRRWRGPERFPSWMRRALDDPSIAPAGLRGTPAGAVNLPGLGLFHRGWVVIHGGSPLFVYRWRRKPRAVDLGVSRALAVIPTTLHTRVDLGDLEGRSYALYFSHDGPEPADLRAQFHS